MTKASSNCDAKCFQQDARKARRARKAARRSDVKVIQARARSAAAYA